jgi:hypothetical protein
MVTQCPLEGKRGGGDNPWEIMICMARITIYLRDDVEAKARKAAKAKREPVTRRIAAQVKKSVGETWPQAVLDAAGALPDFPELDELRKGYAKNTRHDRRGIRR